MLRPIKIKFSAMSSNCFCRIYLLKERERERKCEREIRQKKRRNNSFFPFYKFHIRWNANNPSRWNTIVLVITDDYGLLAIIATGTIKPTFRAHFIIRRRLAQRREHGRHSFSGERRDATTGRGISDGARKAAYLLQVSIQGVPIGRKESYELLWIVLQLSRAAM